MKRRVFLTKGAAGVFALGAVGPNPIRNLFVFNPDNEVKERFNALLGQATKRRFKFFDARFDNAIRQIRGFFK